MYPSCCQNSPDPVDDEHETSEDVPWCLGAEVFAANPLGYWFQRIRRMSDQIGIWEV